MCLMNEYLQVYLQTVNWRICFLWDKLQIVCAYVILSLCWQKMLLFAFICLNLYPFNVSFKTCTHKYSFLTNWTFNLCRKFLFGCTGLANNLCFSPCSTNRAYWYVSAPNLAFDYFSGGCSMLAVAVATPATFSLKLYRVEPF